MFSVVPVEMVMIDYWTWWILAGTWTVRNNNIPPVSCWYQPSLATTRKRSDRDLVIPPVLVPTPKFQYNLHSSVQTPFLVAAVVVSAGGIWRKSTKKSTKKRSTKWRRRVFFATLSLPLPHSLRDALKQMKIPPSLVDDGHVVVVVVVV
jgi:hypothetical protein